MPVSTFTGVSKAESFVKWMFVIQHLNGQLAISVDVQLARTWDRHVTFIPR